MPNDGLCKNDYGYVATREVDLYYVDSATNRTVVVGMVNTFRTTVGILHVTMRTECPNLFFTNSNTTTDINHFLMLSVSIAGNLSTIAAPLVGLGGHYGSLRNVTVVKGVLDGMSIARRCQLCDEVSLIDPDQNPLEGC